MTPFIVQEGAKSALMWQALEEKELIRYQAGALRHQNCLYTPLTSSTTAISTKRIACMGALPTQREVILLDPDHSPLLHSKFLELRAALPEGAPVQTILTEVQRFVGAIFEPALSTEAALGAFICHWISHPSRKAADFTPSKKGVWIPAIFLDDFLRARTGRCRHRALATSYFIDRLLRETTLLPQGEVYTVRELISPELGHAWNLFLSDDKKEAWHLDTSWQMVLSYHKEDHLNLLYQSYGLEATESILRRFGISNQSGIE